MSIKLQALRFFSLMFALVFACVISATAQTKVFSYQGSLTDGTTTANGTYQMEFRIYDSEKNGKPLQVISDNAVTVKNGVFKVNLNINSDVTAARYLEIAVRKATETSFTTLPERQIISNSPYFVKTLSAAFDGGDALPASKDAPDGLSGGNRVFISDRPAASITYTAGQSIAGRTVTINKNFPETQLRVTYIETFQAGQNPTPGLGFSNGQVFITCDGLPPYDNPGIIGAIVFPIGNASFLYGQANIVGYVTGLPAGNHTIGVMVASNSLTTFTRYQYLLEVQEVRTR